MNNNIMNNNINKELLWNILYKNNIFANIPNTKLDNIKNIFEETINETLNNIDSNINNIEINKIILKKINTNINNYKNKLLLPVNIKDEFINKKNESITKDFQKNIEDFKEYNVKKNDSIDFSDKIDEPLDSNNMNLILEKLQREREYNTDNTDYTDNINNTNTNNTNTDNTDNINNTNINNTNINNTNTNTNSNNINNSKISEKKTINENSINIDVLNKPVDHRIKISNIDELLNANLEVTNLKNNINNNINNDIIKNINIDNNNFENRLKILEEKLDIILKNQELIIEKINTN
tara:strand:+ start:1287 stop:2171 length:885 start_codon:yes stop_codon:yes gene_type:complete